MFNVSSLADDLLPGFAARRLILEFKDSASDSLYPDVAFLVSRREIHNPEQAWVGQRAVLHIGSFFSGFVNPEIAVAVEQAGWSFTALDVRRQGRSAREVGLKIHCDVQSLRIYFEEISKTVKLLRQSGASQVVLHGEGGGALVGALYAAEYKYESELNFDALILSSPWFNYVQPWYGRFLSRKLADLASVWKPSATLSITPPGLSQAAYLLNLSPEIRHLLPTRPQRLTARFISALYKAQDRLQQGLDLNMPILLACARRSTNAFWSTRFERSHTDCVLEIEDMLAGAHLLGKNLQFLRVDDGVHNLSASLEPARSKYFAGLQDFLKTLDSETTC